MPTRRLNEIASESEQNEWLNQNSRVSIASDGRINSDSHEYNDRAVGIFLSRYWPETKSFLKEFISGCLFLPQSTEKIWWSITAEENSKYVRINVGPQEILKIVPHDSFHFHILLTESCLDDADYTDINLTSDAFKKPSHYRTIGNQIWLESENPAVLTNFFLRPNFRFAAKDLSLRLMRKQVSNWGRFHCFTLVDEIFNEHPPSAEALEIAKLIDRLPDIDRAEIQRVVWIRINTERFSAPVKATSRCAVTGIGVPQLLEACHIKPWSECSTEEKLDPNNGLCLASHVHKCFDADLLAIKPDGSVIISASLSSEDRALLGLREVRIQLRPAQIPYVQWRYERILGSFLNCIQGE